MSIIAALPTTINNGDLEDATVVMSLFNFLRTQVNSGAQPLITAQPYLKVRRVTAWAPGASPVIVPFDQVDSDTASGWNGVTDLYTIPTSGKYEIHSYVKFTSANIGDAAGPAIYINGVRTLDGSGTKAYAAAIELWGNVGGTLNLIAGDTVGVYFVGDLVAMSLGATNVANYLTITRIGP